MLVFSMFLAPLVVMLLLGIVFLSGVAGSISENPESPDNGAANKPTRVISSQNPEDLLPSPIQLLP